MRARSIRLIATPQPHQRIRQGLLEDTVVTMTRAEAKDKTVLITLDFEGFRRPPPGHDPVVTGSLGITSAKVVLRYVREDTQRFFLTVFDQLHTRMVLPGAEWV